MKFIETIEELKARFPHVELSDEDASEMVRLEELEGKIEGDLTIKSLKYCLHASKEEVDALLAVYKGVLADKV